MTACAHSAIHGLCLHVNSTRTDHRPAPSESWSVELRSEDDSGNVLRIERNAMGVASAIVAPFGQRTQRTINVQVITSGACAIQRCASGA
jgi:hypothetical protein